MDLSLYRGDDVEPPFFTPSLSFLSFLSSDTLRRVKRIKLKPLAACDTTTRVARQTKPVMPKSGVALSAGRADVYPVQLFSIEKN